MSWYQLERSDDPQLNELAARYHVHPLHIEDCKDPDTRTKIEQSPDYHFVVLRPLHLEQSEDELKTSPLFIFVGKNFCITVGDMECPPSGRRWNAPCAPGEILHPTGSSISSSTL